MKEYPELWKVAQRIEGLVCRVGEHAGGVIFVDEPFINSTALMKAPNGDTITQFDLHDCEACSLIKIDLLSVEALDKIHICLDLLLEAGYITPEATFKETYEKYIGIYNLERENQDMWKMVWNHEIQALFQMEKQSGVQGIALTKPKSVDDLAVLNSVIRLMAQEKDAEQPLVKYARFKNDIRYWYQEMNQYGLGDDERKLLEPIVGLAYGICESQEKFMQLVQMPECGGFDLMWADRLRKSIAKKNPAEYDALTKEYFENAKQKQLNKNLCNYVWNVLVATSRGYGFNASHTLAYSLVALQEMNLASRFPIIFWNCACLIADSGGAEEEQLDEEIVDIYEPEDFEEFEYEDAPDKKTKTKKKRSNNYDKIATAIGKMRKAGVIISPPDINKSSYTFYPDVEKNQIFYGLRGILNVGDEVINNTIANRPYISPRDYLNRVKPNKQAMISLIKGGAFDNLMERKLCMAWYINETCDKKQRLTLQNLPSLIKYDLIPNQTEKQIMARRVYEFNRYLKAMCKVDNETYKVDERAINFLVELDANNLIDSDYLVSAKKWDKVYQKWMDVFREWIAGDKENILTTLNDIVFKEDWDKYAKGNFSSWEMESLSFYYHEHELEKVYKEKYGFADFEQLSPEPVVDKTFTKNGKEIKMFKLSKICGTCIAKDKAKATVTLLTTTGVVNVKFRKEYYAMFDKQISERQEDGTKKVKERSWFNRGQMIVVSGMRSEDNFVAKKYASTGGHTLYRITEILPDGDIILQSERYKGEEEEDNG